MGFVFFFFFFPPSSSIFIVLLNPVKGDCETTIKQGLLYSGLLGRGFDHQLCCRCVALPVIGGISEIIDIFKKASKRTACGFLEGVYHGISACSQCPECHPSFRDQGVQVSELLVLLSPELEVRT